MSITEHKFNVPTNPYGAVLRGCGSIGGGFNIASTGESTSDWSVVMCRTGGTGNHGTAALVPQSEDAAHIAEAISAAYFDGLLDVLGQDWPSAIETLAKVRPPIGAEVSPAFSIFARDGVFVWRWDRSRSIDNPLNYESVAAYFCLESDYPTAGRGLPGIYDRPAYQFRYLGGGDEETLQTLERLGIYTPPATDSDD